MRTRSSAPVSCRANSGQDIARKCKELGFFGCNFPEEVGGAGLDHHVLHAGRTRARPRLDGPHRLLRPPFRHPDGLQRRAARKIPAAGGQGRQVRRARHDRAGCRLRRARHEVLCPARTATTGSSTAPSISSAMPTSPISSSSSSPRVKRTRRAGRRRRSPASSSTAARPGFEIRKGYSSVSHRGYNNCILTFDDCRLPSAQILGEVHKGFDVANDWLLRHTADGGCDLGRPRASRLRLRAELRRRAQAVRQADRRQPGRLLQARRHDHRDRRRRSADAFGRLAPRPGPALQPRDRLCQGLRHRNACPRHRRGDPDLSAAWG